MTIKPIETVYNGYRFRSRLEARWAVFFDMLEIRYEYEPQGFEVINFGRYLPDFWLPDLRCWVEIKPLSSTRVYEPKYEALAKGTGFNVLHSVGNPWLGEYGITFYEPDGISTSDALAWAGGSCGGIWLANDEWACYLGGLPAQEMWEIEKGQWPEHRRFVHAYTAARQARFEHGETPR